MQIADCRLQNVRRIGLQPRESRCRAGLWPLNATSVRSALCALRSALCILLVGCTVGPDFQRPKAEAPEAWEGTHLTSPGQPSIAAPQPIEVAEWWRLLNDPKLTSLVKDAVEANLDLKQAEARLREVRAAYGVATAGFWPSLSASAAYQRGQGSGARGGPHDLFSTGLDAAWELDIFGGTRRGIEAAGADIQAAVEDRRDVLVTLAGEVALNYVNLRGFQQRIRIAQETLQAQRHSADLTRQRFNAGLASGLDVANADAEVATTESQIPTLETGARQSLYALSVLLARPPAALVSEFSTPGPVPTTPPQAPVGLPSELLRRRPDIRRSEAQIHAATARIGVAKADLFPKFSLTGSGGYGSDKLSTLIRSRNFFWSAGPTVDWQLFGAGRVQSNIELQKALQEQTVIAYQQTVLTAFQEVENALVAFAMEQRRRQWLDQAVTLERKAAALSMQLYTEGQTDFLNVLTAQRSLYASEDALVQSHQAVAADLIALYKALGGGWEIERR